FQAGSAGRSGPPRRGGVVDPSRLLGTKRLSRSPWQDVLPLRSGHPDQLQGSKLLLESRLQKLDPLLKLVLQPPLAPLVFVTRHVAGYFNMRWRCKARATRRDSGRGLHPPRLVLCRLGALLAQVEVDDLLSVALGTDAAVVEPQAAGAVGDDVLRGMGDEDHGGAGVVEPPEAFLALLVEVEITHREHLVEDQDIGHPGGGDGETETGLHTGGVVAQRSTDEV